MPQSAVQGPAVSLRPLSVASNLAEGYARDGDRKRIRFLVMARGSCAECWTQLQIGAKAGVIDANAAVCLAKKAGEIAAMISGLIK
jgi:four helix bundle protein